MRGALKSCWAPEGFLTGASVCVLMGSPTAHTSLQLAAAYQPKLPTHPPKRMLSSPHASHLSPPLPSSLRPTAAPCELHTLYIGSTMDPLCMLPAGEEVGQQKGWGHRGFWALRGSRSIGLAVTQTWWGGRTFNPWLRGHLLPSREGVQMPGKRFARGPAC